MKKLLLVCAVLVNALLASAVDSDFTEKFEKRSIYGKWIDIDKGRIIEINSKTNFSFERLDNNLIILKEGKSKNYLKRIGALKTRITGRVLEDRGGKKLVAVKNASVTLVNIQDNTIQATINTDKKGYFKDMSLPSGTYKLTTKRGKKKLKIYVTLTQKNEAIGTLVLRSTRDANFKSKFVNGGNYIISNNKRTKSYIEVTNYGGTAGKVCYKASMHDRSLSFLGFRASCKKIKPGKKIKLPIFMSFKPIKINSVQKDVTITLTDARGRKLVEKHSFDVYKNFFTLKVKGATPGLKGYVLLPGEQLKVINIKKGRLLLPKLSDEKYRLILANPNPKLKTSYEVDIGAEYTLRKGIKIASKKSKKRKHKKRKKKKVKRVNPFKLKQSIGRYPDVGDIAIYQFRIPDSIVMNEDDKPINIRFSNTNDIGQKVKYKVSLTNSSLAKVTYNKGVLHVAPYKNRNGITTITLKSKSVGYGKKNKKYFTLIVRPVNDKPRITSKPPLTVIENTKYSYYLRATDKETRYLIKKAISTPKWLKFNPVNGLLSGTPRSWDADKSYKIQLLVSDGRDEIRQKFTIKVIGLSRAPKVKSAFFAMKEDTVLHEKLTAKVRKGLAIAFSVKTKPKHGTLKLNRNGVFTYTPYDNYFGNDSFRFKVSSKGKSSISKVNISIKGVNDAPTAENFVLNDVGAGPVRIDWNKLSNAMDIDEDKLHVEINSAGKLGSVRISDEFIIYTPQANTKGSDTVSVKVMDGVGAYAEITITLNGIDKKLTPKVLQTGQTIIYHNYDDAIYKKSVPRAYVKEVNSSVVLDKNSQKNWYVDEKMDPLSFEDAQAYCEELALEDENMSDWRLPTIKELVLLTDKGRASPAIDPIFKGVRSDYYWTNTVYKKRPGNIWVVYFDYGEDYYRNRHTLNYTLCISDAKRTKKVVNLPKEPLDTLMDTNSTAIETNTTVIDTNVDRPSVEVLTEDNKTEEESANEEANALYELLNGGDAVDTTLGQALNITLESNSTASAVVDENGSKAEDVEKEALVKIGSDAFDAINYYERNATLGTVHDTQAELMWYDGDIITPRTWVAAITECENLKYGGFDDWRVPNFNELYRLTDHSGVVPAINGSFRKINEGDYWTSTTSHNDKDRAWGISFSKGSDYTFDKTERIFVRCVRDQQ